jgi:hypothetical protein
MLVVGFSLVSMLLPGHEFWLQPDKFYFQEGESANITFRVGDDFIGEPWKGNADRIVRLDHTNGSDVRDLKTSLRESTEQHPCKVTLAREGAHVIVIESSPAFIKLSGQEFSDYLKEDGLDDVLYERTQKGTSSDTAREFYSRHSKLILQAGSTLDDNYKKEYGLPIEIIPDKNPAGVRKGDPVSFKILFEGKPLFGAKVKVWNRYNNRTSVQNIFSQQNGVIETHVSNPGSWMVSVVKMVPSKDPKADYRSYWGTLVFGVKP